MAELAVFTHKQWTDLQIVGAQATAVNPLDFSVGSDLLALAEGSSATLLYLQADILTILGLTRAATSFGNDLDTFFADFDFPRLPATYASGIITLHRDDATGASPAIIADGAANFLIDNQLQRYVIIADNEITNYSSTDNSYIAAPGQTDLQVLVIADISGTVGNVPIDTEMLLGSGISGFDTATVTAGMANGQPTETDTAYRTRFVLYLRSLSRSTLSAIGAAILSVQANLTYTIANNVNTIGQREPGNFVVTVDDGSGAPSTALLNAVDRAITEYQGNTISHNTRGPSVVSVVVTMTVTLAFGTDDATVLQNIRNAVSDYINTLALGRSLSITRLSNVVYVTSDSVTNVADVTVNGQDDDLIVTLSQVIKLATNGLTITPILLDN